MTAYASKTTVSEDKSRQEIERLLQRHGASRFGVITDYERRTALIGFTYKHIQVQMTIGLPSPDDKAFAKMSNGWRDRADTERIRLYEGEVRRRWRCLVLAIKSKLTSVAEGVTTFEREFLPYMVTATGETIGDRLQPVIEHAMKTGGILPAQLCLPPGENAA